MVVVVEVAAVDEEEAVEEEEDGEAAVEADDLRSRIEATAATSSRVQVITSQLLAVAATMIHLRRQPENPRFGMK